MDDPKSWAFKSMIRNNQSNIEGFEGVLEEMFILALIKNDK